MKTLPIVLLFTLILTSFAEARPTITGVNHIWHPTEVCFTGPQHHETDVGPNPFTDYRLVVDFTGPSNQTSRVPGFFNSDRQGGDSGNQYCVRFATDEEGFWQFEAHFDTGPNIAVDLNMQNGTPISFDGTTGGFRMNGLDPQAPGFYKYGKLEYVGEHYPKFRDGPYFLKGGTDSPENLLGSMAFDNTYDVPGCGVNTNGLEQGLHRYLPHVQDYGTSGVSNLPLFFSRDWGRPYVIALVGALEYLNSKGVNSAYFLTMNLGGDGCDTYPYLGNSKTGFNKTHFDISKMHQWNQVFVAAQKLEILLHFVMAETEYLNERWLDDGTNTIMLGLERKLYYREMVARFGHAPAIKWNLSEESDFTTAQSQSFAGYLKDLDPYDHPIAFHTNPLPQGGSGHYQPYANVMGDDRFSASSIQGWCEDAGRHMEKWRHDSMQSGHPWIVEYDEQMGGLDPHNTDAMRKKCLWDVYFSGGTVEWYFGYHGLPLGGDMRTEDFRTREEMWDYMRYARLFMEDNLQFWRMNPADDLVTGENGNHGGAEVFALANEEYAIYYPNASQTGTVDLSNTNGTFTARWFNPRSGTFASSGVSVSGGPNVTFQPGSPPANIHQDWVLLIKK